MLTAPKTISLTFHQRVRITIIIKAQTGTRKDTGLRVLQDLRKRIGLPNAELEKFVREAGPDRVQLNMATIAKQPGSDDLPITTAEARVLLEKIDALQLSPDDLDDWADDLGTKLQAVIG